MLLIFKAYKLFKLQIIKKMQKYWQGDDNDDALDDVHDDDDDDDLCLIGIGNYWQVTSAQSTNNNLQQTTDCQLIVGYDNW